MILRKASEEMNIGNHMFTCTQSHTRTTTTASYGTDNNIVARSAHWRTKVHI
jgi:hypothetical protein